MKKKPQQPLQDTWTTTVTSVFLSLAQSCTALSLEVREACTLFTVQYIVNWYNYMCCNYSISYFIMYLMQTEAKLPCLKMLQICNTMHSTKNIWKEWWQLFVLGHPLKEYCCAEQGIRKQQTNSTCTAIPPSDSCFTQE